MKIKLNFTLFLLLTLAIGLQARQRSVEEAKSLAASHYNGLQQLRSAQDVDFELVYTGETTGLRASSEPYYYVFNVSDTKGFVMVSGDDLILPILGYSTNGEFNPDTIPANLLGWLKEYERQIDYALSQPTLTLSASTPKLRSGDAFPDHIEPMITTKWGQDAPYNDMCPMDGNARSVTGCIATSAAQVMYYHKWPEKGKGQITYHANMLNRDISVNFEDYTFDWENMTELYDSTSTAIQNKAVAELMYAAGAACKMDYSSAASGAAFTNLAKALRTYMGYDENLHIKFRDYYSSAEWIRLIKTELASQRPVIYGEQSYNGAHSLICDGYDNEGLFHINWGWDGWFDGYFQLDILNPYLPYDAGMGGFSYAHNAIVGIQKPTSTSTKPETVLLQELFRLPVKKYAQGDSLFTYAVFICEGNTPTKIEIGLALYEGDKLYKLLSTEQREVDPAPIYYDVIVDTIAPFHLPTGEYYLQYIYRESGKEQWKNVAYNKASNSYNNYLLKASQDSIIVLHPSDELTYTELKAEKELRQNAANMFRMKIKNLQSREVNPLLMITYKAINNKDEFKILSMEGIYLSANEEKELMMPVFLDMEPGVYDFYILYDKKDGSLYYILDEPLTLEVFPEEEETANEELTVSSDLEMSVSAKILSVRSDSPIESVSIFDLNGKMLRRISPAAMDVTIPVGWAPEGLYVVVVKNATGWHRDKIIVR